MKGPQPNPCPCPNPNQAEPPLRDWQQDGRLWQATSVGEAAFEGIAIALTLAVFLLWLCAAANCVWVQLAPALESISLYLSLPIYRSIYPERVSQLEPGQELGQELGSITCSEAQVCSQVCSWSWKALRCSAGCRPRMHWPGLQGSCTPM